MINFRLNSTAGVNHFNSPVSKRPKICNMKNTRMACLALMTLFLLVANFTSFAHPGKHRQNRGSYHQQRVDQQRAPQRFKRGHHRGPRVAFFAPRPPARLHSRSHSRSYYGRHHRHYSRQRRGCR